MGMSILCINALSLFGDFEPLFRHLYIYVRVHTAHLCAYGMDVEPIFFLEKDLVIKKTI